MDMMLRNKYCNFVAGNVREWVNLNGREEYILDAVKSIESLLENYRGDPADICNVIGIDLSQIFFYYSVLADYCLIEERADFISNLVKGYSYLRLGVRFDYINYKVRGYYSPGGFGANDYFYFLLLSIALDDREGFSIGYKYCKELFNSQSFAENDSLDVPLAYFTMGLCEINNGADHDSVAKFHPSFDGLFNFWEDDGENIEEAMCSALDYHLISACDYKLHQVEHRNMFPNYVYAQGFLSENIIAFPVEMIAYFNLRERMGFNTPKIAHPLMNRNMIYTIKSFEYNYKDELLEKLYDVLKILE